MAVDPLVVREHRVRDLAETLDAQQQARTVGRVALDQPPLGGVQLAAAEQDVVGQRLLADVVQQAGGVRDRLLVLAQPGRARELARVVGDGRGVPGGARVAQRERLEQQPDHPLVADVELVLAAQRPPRRARGPRSSERSSSWQTPSASTNRPTTPVP